MTDLLHDLFDDLREKRLLPVALVLLAALVAVPLVLMKPGGDEPASDSAAGATPAPQSAVVGAVGGGPSEGSDLGFFDSKDPFKSGVKVKRPGAGNGVAQLVNPPATLPGATGSGPVGAAPTGGGPSGGAPKDLVPPNTVTQKTPSTTPRLRRVRRDYMYVVDVKFGQTGSERTRKGVKRLSILPNDRNPVVIVLGVAADAKRAVFLVDSRASQSGEGACRPSVKSCTFLYLRREDDRDEQFLTDDQGREYHLTLLGIRKIELKKASRKARAKSSVRRIGASRKVRFPELAPDLQR